MGNLSSWARQVNQGLDGRRGLAVLGHVHQMASESHPTAKFPELGLVTVSTSTSFGTCKDDREGDPLAALIDSVIASGSVDLAFLEVHGSAGKVICSPTVPQWLYIMNMTRRLHSC